MDEEKLKALEAKLSESEARIAAFEKENAELREGSKRSEAQAFFAKLRDEGKLPPAQFERVISLDVKLGEAERKEFRAMWSEAEVKVDLSGSHAAPKGKAPPADAGDAALTAKIRAFQKEKGFSSFSEAADAYYAANPQAFEIGGIASYGGGMIIARPFIAETDILAGTGVVQGSAENYVMHPDTDGEGDFIGVFDYDPKKPSIEAGLNVGIALSGVVKVRAGATVNAGKRAVLKKDATGRFVEAEGAGLHSVCGVFLQSGGEDEYVEMLVERGSVTIKEEEEA